MKPWLFLFCIGVQAETIFLTADNNQTVTLDFQVVDTAKVYLGGWVKFPDHADLMEYYLGWTLSVGPASIYSTESHTQMPNGWWWSDATGVRGNAAAQLDPGSYTLKLDNFSGSRGASPNLHVTGAMSWDSGVITTASTSGLQPIHTPEPATFGTMGLLLSALVLLFRRNQPS